MSASDQSGAPGEQPGDVIDRYKLLQELGTGGMGTVWMAEQEQPVRRKVALKIIKLGMDTREVVARFEAERQALALMDHPNIAKVLDGGASEQGRPFFAMELVRGVPITDYCEQHDLDIDARLELFIKVADAIQHAHHKGIIHRDIKPSNVMVSLHDGVAEPKVIDFGIAKATNSELTHKTLFTRYAEMIGTPDYMAPEQAEMSGLDVDTRADVYSLGVLLYELLCSQKPFDAHVALQKGYSELLRTIREVVPSRPSTRITNGRHLSGELDWIVMRAIEKDRLRRYETANGFAEDVRRYLRGEPVLAAPPSVSYRLRKFARRNRTAVLAAMIVLVAIGIAGWIWFDARSAREAQRTFREQRASAAMEEVALAIGKAIAASGSSETEWVSVDAAEQRVRDILADGELAADVRTRARDLLDHVQDVRTEHDLAMRLENVLITCASHYDLESWQRMELELEQLLREQGVDLAKDDPDLVATKIRDHLFDVRLADILELWIATRAQVGTMGGLPATAERMQPWAEAIYKADPDPLRTGIRRILYEQRKPDRSELDRLCRGVNLAELSPRTLSWLATIYNMAGFADRADEIVRDAIRQHPRDTMLAFDRGFGQSMLGRHQDALRMYSRALALRPDAAGIWRMMGKSFAALSELQNAREAFEESCRLEDYAPTWLDLGEVLLRSKDGAAAVTAARHALAMSPGLAAGHGVLGRALMLQGKLDEALGELQRCEELAAEDPTWQGDVASWLAECRRRIDDR